MRKTLITLAAMTLMLTTAGLAPAQEEQKDAGSAAKEKKTDKQAGKETGRANAKAKDRTWRIAVMTYTFNRFSLLESIDKAKKVGAQYIETFAWQKIGDKFADAQFNPAAPEEALKAVKKKLNETGIKITGCYFHDFGKDEAEAKKIFAFCKKMGIEIIIGEPPVDKLEMLDKLASESKVKVAIHNHPKDPKKTEYANWQPEAVMKQLAGRSAWLGTCADNGHWVRSGLDPVECIKKYKGRLFCMHLKDVNKIGPDAHDVPYGEGVVKLDDLFAALREIKFHGVFSIEYENNMDNNMPDVEKCIAWFEKSVKQARTR